MGPEVRFYGFEHPTRSTLVFEAVKNGSAGTYHFHFVWKWTNLYLFSYTVPCRLTMRRKRASHQRYGTVVGDRIGPTNPLD